MKKIGDLVRLRSGSPLLTIAGGSPALWRLTWFDGAHLCETELPDEALVPAEDAAALGARLTLGSPTPGESILTYVSRTWPEIAGSFRRESLAAELYTKIRDCKGARGPFVHFETEGGGVYFWPQGPHGAFMKRAKPPSKKRGSQ